MSHILQTEFDVGPYRSLALFVYLFVFGATAPSEPRPPHSRGF